MCLLEHEQGDAHPHARHQDQEHKPNILHPHGFPYSPTLAHWRQAEVLVLHSENKTLKCLLLLLLYPVREVVNLINFNIFSRLTFSCVWVCWKYHTRDLRVHNIFGPKTFWVQENFGSKKYLGPNIVF